MTTYLNNKLIRMHVIGLFLRLQLQESYNVKMHSFCILHYFCNTCIGVIIVNYTKIFVLFWYLLCTLDTCLCNIFSEENPGLLQSLFIHRSGTVWKGKFTSEFNKFYGVKNQNQLDSVYWSLEPVCESCIICDVMVIHMSRDMWFPTMCDLTSVDSDEPLQPPFKLRNSKWCSISSLTIIEYSSD